MCPATYVSRFTHERVSHFLPKRLHVQPSDLVVHFAHMVSVLGIATSDIRKSQARPSITSMTAYRDKLYTLKVQANLNDEAFMDATADLLHKFDDVKVDPTSSQRAAMGGVGPGCGQMV